jgi:hypothetical protein
VLLLLCTTVAALVHGSEAVAAGWAAIFVKLHGCCILIQLRGTAVALQPSPEDILHAWVPAHRWGLLLRWPLLLLHVALCV